MKVFKTLLKGFKALVMGCVFLLGLGYVGHLDNTYKLDAYVKEVRGKSVYIVDTKNYDLWEIKNDNYQQGDELVLYMDRNHTANRYDDIIYDIKLSKKAEPKKKETEVIKIKKWTVNLKDYK